MDPNAALAELREILTEIDDMTARAHNANFDSVAEHYWESCNTRRATFLDKFQNLDEWLTNGGSLPADWQH